MKTFWGDNENDIAVDRATPHLVKMLAHCQAILDDCGVCHQYKPCTDLWHDWEPVKKGETK